MSGIVVATCPLCKTKSKTPLSMMKLDDKIVGWIANCATPGCKGVLAIRAKDVVSDDDK